MPDECPFSDALDAIRCALLGELALDAVEEQHDQDLEAANDGRSTWLKGEASRPRKGPRNLPSLILISVHEACDLGELGTASALLRAAEAAFDQNRPLSLVEERNAMDKLVAAHSRIWHLRHDRELLLQDPLVAVQ